MDPEEAVFGPRPAAAAPPASSYPPGKVPTFDDPEAAWFGERAKAAEVPETPSEKVLNTVRAASGAAIEALPIVGPPLRAGLDRLSSVRLEGGSEEAYKRIRGSAESLATKHPEATSFGKGTGQALGWSALATKFPELFGMVGGPVARSIAGATGVGTTSAADAVMRGEDPLAAGVVGGFAGLLTPAIGGVVKSLATSTVKPAIAALARIAIDKYGIKIAADQIAKNPMIKIAGSVAGRLPGSGGTTARGRQLEALNRGITKTFGENATDLSEDVIAHAHTRLGGMFDDFITRVPVMTRDPAMDQGLIDMIKSADMSVDANEIRPIAKQIESVLSMFQKGGGAITGAEWKSMTQEGSALSDAQNSTNANISGYANRLRDILNGVMERSASPADVALIKQARSQYRNLMTVRPLAAKAATGEIKPGLLLGAVIRNYGEKAVATGQAGELGELAKIASAFMIEPGSSNSAERALILGLESATGAGLAGLHSAFDTKTMIAGTLAPLAISRGLGSTLRSAGVVNSLIRATPTPGLVSKTAPVVSAIAGRKGSERMKLLPPPAPTEAAP